MKRLFITLLLITNIASAQVKVTFTIQRLPAQKIDAYHIYLAGSFNNWSPGNSDWELKPDHWASFVVVKNMTPGKYEYKLTRGSWDNVECDKNGVSVSNRLLNLTRDTLISLDVADWQDFHQIVRNHTLSANVHVISEKFDMPQLGRQRRVWIYLPKGYETSKKQYPVIYMQDGQNLFDELTAGFGQEWGVDEFMDSLKNKPQSIIVGIDHGGDQRVMEYDPYDSKYGKGRGYDYTRFLVETLKPYIDGHYRTLRDVKHTTVAGSSMGGIISLYAAVKYPDVFGNAAVFSPAFWISPLLPDYVKAHANTSTRFYFVCGDAESDTMVSDMQKMVDILKAKGIPGKNIPVTVIKGAKHNEQQWRGAFPAFYDWLMMKK
jgi:alpha-glucosidase